MTSADIFAALEQDRPVPGRHLVIVAHADDETISFGGAMSRLAEAVVVQLTDGGSPGPAHDADASRRRAERQDAYAAGRWSWPVIEGPCAQREVYMALRRLRALLRVQGAFDVVWTHPYEHGHIDHDSAAWLGAQLPEIPLHLEFASYFMGADARSHFGVFAPHPQHPPELVVTLVGDRLARKRAALAAYRSQARILQKFQAIDREAYRVAPHYDFAQPASVPIARWDKYGYGPSTTRWRALVAEVA